MSKFLLPTLIFSLALWLLFGSFWLGRYNTKEADQAPLKNKFVVKNEFFKASSSTIFAFSPSEEEVIMNDEQLAVLDSLALYLDRSPEKQLFLSAFYSDSEKNYTDHNNIGIARAHTIKNILARRGAPEMQIKVKGQLVEHLKLNENGLISGGIEFDIFDRDFSTEAAQKLKDTKIVFPFSNDQQEVDQNIELETELAKMKQYLIDFPDSKLQITAYYNDTSKNNLQAQKRADLVFRFLLDKKVNNQRINPVALKRKADASEDTIKLSGKETIYIEITLN